MAIPHHSLDDEHEISYEAEGVRFPDNEDEDECEYEDEDEEVSQQIQITFEDEADEDVFGGASHEVCPFLKGCQSGSDLIS
jgi:hypothetical protein